MTSSVPTTTVRIDPDLKREANAVFDELGISMSTAVNMFLRAVVRNGGLPPEVCEVREGRDRD